MARKGGKTMMTGESVLTPPAALPPAQQRTVTATASPPPCPVWLRRNRGPVTEAVRLSCPIQGLSLLPRLERNGVIIPHCNLELLNSSNPHCQSTK
ncbi:hypothetical protein AAY473_005725 [Plecturocebus cupreus]